jgi:transcriptional regulator with AAA-type ATPase domain
MNEETETTPESRATTDVSAPVPVLLLAYSPLDNEKTADRWPLKDELTIGRKHPADLAIDDEYLSKPHLRIVPKGDAFYLEDLNSTNGTFINGMPLFGRQQLADSDIIRAGRSIFVFHEDGQSLLEPCPPDIYGIGGRFHLAPLLKEIRRYSNSHSHVLIYGATGSGKELAAKALARMANRDIVVHNAGRMRSDSEAEVILFGVGHKVFTDVGERTGIIELADGKFLFLDEVHSLPQSVQRMLLRVMEDWRLTRVGETESKEVDVRVIMASNDPSSPHYGIEPDLLGRMRVVKIQTLKERVADIPSIFRYILRARLASTQFDVDAVLKYVATDFYECLCLDGFEEDNTRGLMKIVDDIVTEIKSGELPDKCIEMIFKKRYRHDLVLTRASSSTRKKSTTAQPSTENAKRTHDDDILALTAKFNLDVDTLELIKDAYYSQKGVVTDVVQRLRAEHDFNTSHRRIKNIIDAMGLPRTKRKRV